MKPVMVIKARRYLCILKEKSIFFKEENVCRRKRTTMTGMGESNSDDRRISYCRKSPLEEAEWPSHSAEDFKMQHFSEISKTTPSSQFVSKEDHLTSQ